MKTNRGSSFPLGATVVGSGVNFSVFSRNGTAVTLLLFDGETDAAPRESLRLDARTNRTADYWHIFVEGLRPGQLYGYRIDGLFAPADGLRFDGEKVLLDPYGRGVCAGNYDRAAASVPGNNEARSLKSVVTDVAAYDWEGDAPLGTPYARTVIYELHVAGFTRHPNSGVREEKRGTYAGLMEKIPYLQDLGVTAVELLPVFAFDQRDAPAHLNNYWGYSPLSFFAPHAGYSSSDDPLACLDEFRDMVKALHRAGIEVILDVVYNHTAEGNEGGPTISFRGFECATYYMLEADKRRFADYTGCGNTLNANQAVVRRMIADSVRYWVEQMHIDGFRFDLASILSRDETGKPMATPPILWDLDSDPVLAKTKLIAEAWDAAGLYQVGSFIGDNWKEWNGKFRDDIRSFIKADAGSLRRLPNRLLGSPDLYEHLQQQPEQCINFVTCHDGFTLNDLVSYNEKHNEANGEQNRDGSDQNLSWNGGVEGATGDAEIEQLRTRQIKNFLANTLLSIGVPMIGMGDEVRRTQFGNNNAYCQDNEVSWFDWSLVEKHSELWQFVRQLIDLRMKFAATRSDESITLTEFLGQAQLQWHGTRLSHPDWGDDSHALALTAQNLAGKKVVHCIWNSYWEPLSFELPLLPADAGKGWMRVIDTALPGGQDISLDNPYWLRADTYLAEARSIVILGWTATT